MEKKRKRGRPKGSGIFNETRRTGEETGRKQGRPTKAEMAELRNKFVKEYMRVLDPVAAAEKMGCSQPVKQAKTFMRNPEVKKRIERIQEHAVSDAGVDAAFVVSKMKRVLEYAMQEHEGKHENLDGTMSFELENPKVAMGCLDMLGRYVGMFKDHVEVTNVVNIEAIEAARRRIIDLRPTPKLIDGKVVYESADEPA